MPERAFPGTAALVVGGGSDRLPIRSRLVKPGWPASGLPRSGADWTGLTRAKSAHVGGDCGRGDARGSPATVRAFIKPKATS